MNKFKQSDKVKCISTNQTDADYPNPTLPIIGEEYMVTSSSMDLVFFGPRTGDTVEIIRVKDNHHHSCNNTLVFPVEDFELVDEQLTDDCVADYDRAMGVLG